MSLEILSREVEKMQAIRRSGALPREFDFLPHTLCNAIAKCLAAGMLAEIKERLPLEDFPYLLECANADGLESCRLWKPLIDLMRAEPSYAKALNDEIVRVAVVTHVFRGVVYAIDDLGAFLMETGKDWRQPVITGLEQGLYYLASNTITLDNLSCVTAGLHAIEGYPGMAIFAPHGEAAFTKALQEVGREEWDRWTPSRRHDVCREWRAASEGWFPAVSSWLEELDVHKPFKGLVMA